MTKLKKESSLGWHIISSHNEEKTDTITLYLYDLIIKEYITLTTFINIRVPSISVVVDTMKALSIY